MVRSDYRHDRRDLSHALRTRHSRRPAAHRPRRHRGAPTWTRPSTFYGRVFGMRCVHEETNEEQGVREAMLVGRPDADGRLRAAARPAVAGRRRSRSSSTAAGPGVQQVAYTVRRRRRGQRARCASAACGCSTTRRGAAPPARGSTSSTPRTPAACSSNWSNRLRPLSYPDAVTSDAQASVRYFTDTSCLIDIAPPDPASQRWLRPAPTGARRRVGGHAVQDILEAIMAAEGSPPIRTAELAGDRRAAGPRDATAASWSAPTRPRCSTAWPPATRTRASRCTCRRCRPRSSAPGEALVAVMASAINYNTVWT